MRTPADLIDKAVTVGENRWYRFTMEAGPPNADGRIGTFTANARPLVFGVTGCQNFLLEQSIVIFQTWENRPATTSDFPL